MKPHRRTKLETTDENQIRNWRLYRKIETQKGLAELTKAHDPKRRGVPRGTICRLESGDARWNQDQLSLLSAALGCDIEDLIATDPFNAGDVFSVYAGLSAAAKKRALAYMAKLKS